jgi:hypothetical protein
LGGAGAFRSELFGYEYAVLSRRAGTRPIGSADGNPSGRGGAIAGRSCDSVGARGSADDFSKSGRRMAYQRTGGKGFAGLAKK